MSKLKIKIKHMFNSLINIDDIQRTTRCNYKFLVIDYLETIITQA